MQFNQPTYSPQRKALSGFNQPTYNPLTAKIGGAYDRAANTMAQASGTYGKMQAGRKTETKGPGVTAGGAVMSGLAGVGAGAAMAGAGGAGAATAAVLGGPLGIGALAIGAYLFS